MGAHEANSRLDSVPLIRTRACAGFRFRLRSRRKATKKAREKGTGEQKLTVEKGRATSRAARQRIPLIILWLAVVDLASVVVPTAARPDRGAADSLTERVLSQPARLRSFYRDITAANYMQEQESESERESATQRVRTNVRRSQPAMPHRSIMHAGSDARS